MNSLTQPIPEVVVSTVSEQTSFPFEDVDASLILDLLQQVEASDCINGKKFWKTYGTKWDSLTLEQRNKTVTFWRTNISNETRERYGHD